MKKLLPLAALLLAGCVTTPDGGQQLTPEGQAMVETSLRIAMRHFVEDSPRASERLQNVREVVTRVLAVTTAETTVGALKGVVVSEIKRLHLSSLDEADALDLMELFAASLESRLGSDPIQAAGVIRVSELLNMVLGMLPAPAPPAG